jgi:hypothetical protein
LKKLLQSTTKADKILLSVLILVSLSGIIFIQEVLPKGKTVLIEVDGHPLYVLPIGKDRIVEVEGPEGKTIIELRQEKVRVKDSPCSTRQCVKQGWTEHGVIVCLPNKIVITIGNDNDGVDTVVDAITR